MWPHTLSSIFDNVQSAESDLECPPFFHAMEECKVRLITLRYSLNIPVEHHTGELNVVTSGIENQLCVKPVVEWLMNNNSSCLSHRSVSYLKFCI